MLNCNEIHVTIQKKTEWLKKINNNLMYIYFYLLILQPGHFLGRFI